jgi:excisionase family DNA binding protein
MLEDDVIGTQEAASLLAVTTREVRRKAAEGSLRAFRVEGPAGDEWRFRRSDVIAYLQQRDGKGADGRTDLATVRHLEAVAALQQEAIGASRTLADRLDANTTTNAELKGAVLELVEVLREERNRLAGEVEALREERDRLADELDAERSRGWWDRLVNRSTQV